MESPHSLLEVRDLEVHYGHVEAVRGISFDLRAGGITTLIGANGAGKSSTLMALSRIIPSTGEVRYAGESMAGLSPTDLVKRGVVQVPEGRRVFSRLTVQENLAMGAYLLRDDAVYRSRLDEVFEVFPVLAERRDQKAGTLSGGEQQMLALGRAIMAGPKLLLLDEPSLGLAPIIIQRIFEVLVEINKRGTTMLLVEQNAHLALEVSSQAYVLESGQIVASGPSKELARDERIVEMYLGA